MNPPTSNICRCDWRRQGLTPKPNLSLKKHEKRQLRDNTSSGVNPHVRSCAYIQFIDPAPWFCVKVGPKTLDPWSPTTSLGGFLSFNQCFVEWWVACVVFKKSETRSNVSRLICQSSVTHGISGLQNLSVCSQQVGAKQELIHRIHGAGILMLT